MNLLNPRWRAETRATRTRLRSIVHLDPTALRRDALEIVKDALESDAVAWLDFAPNDEGLCAVRSLTLGDAQVEASVAALQQASSIPWPWSARRSPALPRKRWVDRFATPRSDGPPEWERFVDSDYAKRYLEPFGLADQCGMLVYDGRVLLGWIGGFRRQGEPVFDGRVLRRANTRRHEVRPRLMAAAHVERAQLIPAPMEIVTTLDGEVEAWSEAAAEWLDRPASRRQLRAWCALVVHRRQRPNWAADGLALELRRLTSVLGERILWRLSPSSSVMRDPCYVLSDAELEVARLLAQGATVKEVAELLGQTVETTRTHRRNLYDKLGITSRAELSTAIPS